MPESSISNPEKLFSSIPMEIRPLKREDVPQVLVVQEDCYPRDLLEDEETFSCKLHLFPEGCLGAFEDGRLIAYVFSHPWSFGEYVPLHEELDSLPEAPDCVYIHDIAVLRAWRRQGIADMLITRLFDLAHAHHRGRVALVAVNRSERYWEGYNLRREFSIIYTEGVPATYMTGVLRRK
jgi:GNAT superfamily N-acetyltransferase